MNFWRQKVISKINNVSKYIECVNGNNEYTYNFYVSFEKTDINEDDRD